MVRLFTATGRQFQVYFIIWAWLSYLIAVASLTVEERLQALEDINVEIKQNLAVKSERLETLEIEVQQLKSTVNKLTRERESLNKARTKREGSGIASNNNQPTKKKNTIFRACHEGHLTDPSLLSGMHWVDPDGQGVGEDPIQVYCNMTTGSTSILHDSESPTTVGHCASRGCYSKPIKYSAPKRQMAALIELSSECHQSFRYDCNFAPFETNGVAYSWWNDRNGNPQYFWAGSNASVHTCQCGIDHSCLESVTKCNCDSTLPLLKFDSGVITNKNLLPMTRLNFGRTLLETSSGIYTLGRLKCSGNSAVKGMPSSCADLWRTGHTLNGLYSVMGTSMVESVYCVFTKLPSEAGFETHLGYVDVKSSAVFFYVQKNNSYSVKNTPIPFELERVNIGGALNLTSGIFVAPRAGVYLFTFSGKSFFTSSSRSYLWISLVINDKDIGVSTVDRTGGGYDTFSLQSTLILEAGDRVWLQFIDIHNAYLYDDGNHFTHFTGQFLQEMFTQSSSFNSIGLESEK